MALPDSKNVDKITFQQNVSSDNLRLLRLEAEVMGDDRTGRLSLRQELIGKLTQARNIQAGILIAVLIKLITEWMWSK